MDLGKIIKTAKDLSENETVKNITKNLATNKNVKKAISNTTKKLDNVAKTIKKTTGIDVKDIIKTAATSTVVIEALTKLGLKKEEKVESSAVQKLVGSLKNTISKAVGQKVDNDLFGSVVSKLLGTATVKKEVENVAGKGVASFIKNAVSAYIG